MIRLEIDALPMCLTPADLDFVEVARELGNKLSSVA